MLSIIITHHRTPVLLKLCLKGLRDNLGVAENEIIVADCEVDSEEQDKIRQEFPSVKFVSFSKNIGCAKMVNAGIKEAQGECLLILNPDIIIQSNSVPQMLDYMKENQQVGIVGPQLLTFSNTRQDSCFRFPTIGMILARRTFIKNFKWGQKKMDQSLIRNKDYFSPCSVDWLQGSAMLARREAIDKVGLWDERFFMYFEDTDWCRRFWQKGYKVVYLPTACMFHYYGRHSKKWGTFLDPFLNKYTRIHLISAFKYFWKWRKYEKN